MNFDQKLDVLWAASALSQESHPMYKELHDDIQVLKFERLHNDLTFNQSQKMRDYLTYITKVSPFR